MRKFRRNCESARTIPRQDLYDNGYSNRFLDHGIINKISTNKCVSCNCAHAQEQKIHQHDQEENL